MTGPQPTDRSYGDVAIYLADQLLGAAQEAIAAAELPMPANIYMIHGTGTLIQDPCGGLLWTRVVTTVPTDGSGTPFANMRIDFSIPAWLHSIELGCVWCRPVVDEEGAAVDFPEETEIAVRQGDYRMALLDAAANRFPPEARACCLGSRLNPYSPVGPDGAWTGGILPVDLLTSGLSRVTQ